MIRFPLSVVCSVAINFPPVESVRVQVVGDVFVLFINVRGESSRYLAVFKSVSVRRDDLYLIYHRRIYGILYIRQISLGGFFERTVVRTKFASIAEVDIIYRSDDISIFVCLDVERQLSGRNRLILHHPVDDQRISYCVRSDTLCRHYRRAILVLYDDRRFVLRVISDLYAGSQGSVLVCPSYQNRVAIRC